MYCCQATKRQILLPNSQITKTNKTAPQNLGHKSTKTREPKTKATRKTENTQLRDPVVLLQPKKISEKKTKICGKKVGHFEKIDHEKRWSQRAQFYSCKKSTAGMTENINKVEGIVIKQAKANLDTQT